MKILEVAIHGPMPSPLLGNVRRSKFTVGVHPCTKIEHSGAFLLIHGEDPKAVVMVSALNCSMIVDTTVPPASAPPLAKAK